MFKKRGSNKPGYGGDKATRERVNRRNPRGKKRGGRESVVRGRVTTIKQFKP